MTMTKIDSNSPLLHRDVEIEREFLLGISSLNYALLQRDWTSEGHGDVDLVVTSVDWPKLISAISEFSMAHGMPIVKVYEIEHAVACIILLMEKACVHLDICISPCKNEIFGVSLMDVLENRELIDGIYVVDSNRETAYKNAKKSYKRRPLAKLEKKIMNMAVILRRLRKTTLITRGAIIHIPYLLDVSLLRSKAVIDASQRYLMEELMPKYDSCK